MPFRRNAEFEFVAGAEKKFFLNDSRILETMAPTQLSEKNLYESSLFYRDPCKDRDVESGDSW